MTLCIVAVMRPLIVSSDMLVNYWTNDRKPSTLHAIYTNSRRISANLVNHLSKCEEIPVQHAHPNVDMTLVTDISRTDYDNAKLISFIGEAIDVSKYGSILSIVDGSRGSLLFIHSRNMMHISQAMKQSFKTREFSNCGNTQATAII